MTREKIISIFTKERLLNFVNDVVNGYEFEVEEDDLVGAFLNEFIKDLETLQEPSLPSNLDETLFPDLKRGETNLSK